MKKMNWLSVLLIVGFLTVVSESKTITVSSSNCGGAYSVSDHESLYLNYYGASISECRITVNQIGSVNQLCSSPEKFDLDDCDTELEYHKSSYSSWPDQTYKCTEKQYTDYCTAFSTLVIVFKNTGIGSNSDTIKLKIFSQDNAIVSAVVTSVYVVVGIIVGVIVLVIIITVVVICVCCRRRRSQAGTVYRAPQPAVVTTTTAGYPMQAQAGYQPVQPVYQPQAQQPGYQQPPPQMGYPPPGGYQPAQQAGYPPAPQQGYAGYQTGADPNPNEKASAPPMQPPPYPGN